MAGRRGNNEGTIRKRSDGRWEARITLEGGNTKCYYGKTRQGKYVTEAEAKSEGDRPDHGKPCS